MGTLHEGRANAAPIHNFYTDKSWIEGRSLEQLSHVASWPGMKSVAAFPDLHPGRFGPVGAAFAADRIYPQLVGSDIGCGISVYALSLPKKKLKLDKAASKLRTLSEDYDPVPDTPNDYHGETLSLGTVGSGNHFLELQMVEHAAPASGLRNQQLILMVHTGSRGYGAGLFQSIDERWNDGLHPDEEPAKNYLAMHDNAMSYASLNRDLLALRAARILRSDHVRIIDAPHNLVTHEQGLWVHRKGSTRLVSNQLAPLAGSRDTHSYLMMPRDNRPTESLSSMAHGAGRKYDRASMHGRTRSGKFDIMALSRSSLGGRVICEDKQLLIEEQGTAYKSSKQVADDLTQLGVADVLATLRPLITFKKAKTDA